LLERKSLLPPPFLHSPPTPRLRAVIVSLGEFIPLASVPLCHIPLCQSARKGAARRRRQGSEGPMKEAELL